MNLIQNKWSVIILFLIIGFSIFSPGLFAGFLSDDFGFLLEAKNYGWSAFNHNFKDPFFIPFSHVLGLIQYQIFGENAFAHHFIQLLLHIINAYLIYEILRSFKNTKLAFWSALFFLILPFQSEAVIWLSGKSYVYALLFALLSLKFYFKFQDKCDIKSGWISLLFMGLSMLSKEFSYLLPFIIVSIEWYRYNLLPTKKYLLAAFFGLAIILIARFIVLKDLSGGYGSVHYNFSPTLVFTHFGAYILKYIGFIRFNSHYIIPLISIHLLGMALIQNFKTHIRFILLILILFFLTLLPVINLEITSWNSIESDRYSYFANAIYSIALASTILFINFKTVRIVALSLTTLFFIFTSFLTSINWKNAGELSSTFLNELVKIPEENIILLNVPDNLNGSYVLRNGISQYLTFNNIHKEIEIVDFQSFSSKKGGLEYKNGAFNEIDAKWYYSNIKSNKPYQYDYNSTSAVYTFYNGNFQKVK